MTCLRGFLTLQVYEAATEAGVLRSFCGLSARTSQCSTTAYHSLIDELETACEHEHPSTQSGKGDTLDFRSRDYSKIGVARATRHLPD